MNPLVKLPFLLFDENIPKAKMNPVVRLPLLVLDNENINKTKMNPIVRLPLLVLDKENIKNSSNVKTNPRLVSDECLRKAPVKISKEFCVRIDNLNSSLEKTLLTSIPDVRVENSKSENETQNAETSIETLSTLEEETCYPSTSTESAVPDDKPNDKLTIEESAEEVPEALRIKYQIQMKRLEDLTEEDIKNFVLEKQAEIQEFRIAQKSKKLLRKNEMKDSFKCYPFSSQQQLTMYVTLRQMYNVPAHQYKECRDFFTVLLPEISCQLFAEIFHVKPSYAIRLIKKLYPKSTAPF